MSEIIETKIDLSRRLPLEIVHLIIDLAEFWPHTSSTLEQSMKVTGKTPPIAHSDLAEEGFLLRSLPLGIRCAGGLLSFVYPGFLPCRWLLGIDLAGRRSSLFRFKRVAKPPDTNQGELQWLRPRTRYPARMVIIEILHRGDYRPRGPGNTNKRVYWSDVRKTNFLAPDDDPGLIRVANYQHIRNIDVADLDVPCSPQIPLKAAGVRVGNLQIWRYDDEYQSTLGDNDLRKRDRCAPHVAKQWKSRALRKNLERGQRANFVRSLEVGDSIGLWASVLESGYSSHFEGVKLPVFWAV